MLSYPAEVCVDKYGQHTKCTHEIAREANRARAEAKAMENNTVLRWLLCKTL